jgi:hypothetical protein
MSAVDPMETIRRLRTLVNDDLYRCVDPQNRAAIIGWGTMFNVLYFVDGMTVLHHAGNCFATGPLRRSAMEYAITTVWLADAGDDAADALNSGLQFKLGSLVDGISEAGATARFPDSAVRSAEAVKAVELPKATQANLLHIKHLLDAYDSSEDGDGSTPLRLLYDAESSFAHASLMGAQAFFAERGDAIALGTKPEPREFVPCLEIGQSLLFTTMLAFNKLLIGKPWTDTLQAIADTIGADTKLPKRRQQQPKQR